MPPPAFFAASFAAFLELLLTLLAGGLGFLLLGLDVVDCAVSRAADDDVDVVLGLVVIDVGIFQIVGMGIGPINGTFIGRVGMLIVGNGAAGDTGGAGKT